MLRTASLAAFLLACAPALALTYAGNYTANGFSWFSFEGSDPDS